MNSVDITTINILQTEIDVLQRRLDLAKDQEGMGNYYTAIDILKHRVKELKGE